MKNKIDKMKKFFLSVFIFLFLLTPIFVFANKVDNYGAENVYNNSLLKQIGISTKEPAELAQTAVRLVLGFVGLIMFALVFYAGIIWLKARDNSGEVDKAKNIIESALYGIGIIVLAYAISEFIFGYLVK